MTAVLPRGSVVRVLAAGAALLTAWLATPHAVPLYDGIGVPDEPYRYVSPPAGYQKTPAPSSFSLSVPATGGTNGGDGFYAQTKEIAAQYGLFVSPHSITGPGGTTTLKVTITPQAPDGPAPQGAINGNVYRVQLWADATPTATVAPAAKDMLVYVMRATSARVAAVTMIYRPSGGSWTVVPNTRAGTDSFQAYFVGAGDYALIAAKAAQDSSSHTLVIVILILVVAAMAGAVLLIRLSRRTTPQR